MDFLEVIEKRHSVRKYSDRPVEKEVLDAIVKVAQTAPSSRNSKSSAFMIVEDRDTLDALSQMRDYGSALLSGAQVKGLFVAVSNHALKVGTIVCSSRLRSVNILAYDNMIVCGGIFIADFQLSLNGLFRLTMT